MLDKALLDVGKLKCGLAKNTDRNQTMGEKTFAHHTRRLLLNRHLYCGLTRANDCKPKYSIKPANFGPFSGQRHFQTI